MSGTDTVAESVTEPGNGEIEENGLKTQVQNKGEDCNRSNDEGNREDNGEPEKDKEVPEVKDKIQDTNVDKKSLEPDKLMLEKLHKLNTTNIDLQTEKDDLQNRVRELEKLHTDLTSKVDRFQAQIDKARSELQSMVMKYATSEREVLNLKKHLQESDKKFKESVKERDSLQAKIKDLTNEKKQLISSVERHVLETANLRTEVDLGKNRLDQSNIKVEKLQLQLQSLTLDNESLRSKVNSIEAGIAKLPKRSPKQGERKYSLDDDDDFDDEILDNFELSVPELRSKSTTPTKDSSRESSPHPQNLNSELESSHPESESATDYTALFQQVLETNHRFQKEKDYLHAQNSELELRIEELQNRLAESSARADDYDRKIIIIEEFKQELIRKQNVIDQLKEKFDQINSINRSLIGDIDSSKSKESELLDYTERLTAKLVSLQSGSNNLETQLKEFQHKFDTLQQSHDSLLSTKTELEAEFQRFKEQSQTGSERSKVELEAISEQNVTLRKRVEELENDIAIGKKKHLSALKEMSSELQRLRKNPQNSVQNHSNSVQNHNSNDQATSSSLSSRTGSISSLNNEESSKNINNSINNNCLQVNSTGNSANKNIPAVSHPGQESAPESSTPSESEAPPTCDNSQEIITSLAQIKKSVLIEKLLKLQRILVKRKEKIDFLEEHSEQLTNEIRNKTKLLQNYILKEETGALSTDSMDQNKAYLSKRGGGIMSSLYNSFSTDDSMTLERSLEINAKLHALLEDTLLKNMTLKENLNTLASEIDKLQAK